MRPYSEATTERIEHLKREASPEGSPVEWLAAKAAYEAFSQTMAEWMPSAPDWDALSVWVRGGWLAAARAAKAS
jgi:hypothetical protein